MSKWKGTLAKFQQARRLAFGLYPMMREASAAIAKLTDCIEELRGESPCVPTDRMQVWQRRLSHDFGMSMEYLDSLQEEFARFAGESLKKTVRPIPECTEVKFTKVTVNPQSVSFPIAELASDEEFVRSLLDGIQKHAQELHERRVRDALCGERETEEEFLAEAEESRLRRMEDLLIELAQWVVDGDSKTPDTPQFHQFRERVEAVAMEIKEER